ncbi:MAG: MltA domain-containing protein [Rhodoferax sp.]|nr:MltA domain-containing protein [Rhodoferax sp.]
MALNVKVRLAYAATNEQPYKSIGRWLLEQGKEAVVTYRGRALKIGKHGIHNGRTSCYGVTQEWFSLKKKP